MTSSSLLTNADLGKIDDQIATDSYDVWLISWPPESEIGYHDHGGVTSVIQVVSGSLLESLGAEARSLRPGTSVVTPPYTLHRLWNGGAGEATTFRVYSPPLAAVTYHDGRPSTALSSGPGTGAARTAPIRSRRGEGHQPSRPGRWRAGPGARQRRTRSLTSPQN